MTSIPTSAMSAFLAISNGHLDPSTTLPAFCARPTGNITLTIANTLVSLTPEQYLVPKEQYLSPGLDQTLYYAWFGDGGASNSVNFIIGHKVFEHFYSVYDTTNNRVGLAHARSNDAKPVSQAGTRAPEPKPAKSGAPHNMNIPAPEIPFALSFFVCSAL